MAQPIQIILMRRLAEYLSSPVFGWPFRQLPTIDRHLCPEEKIESLFEVRLGFFWCGDIIVRLDAGQTCL